MEFRFVENPAVVDLTMYIEHTATGKLVRANGEAPLLVDGTKDGETVGDDLRWSAQWGDYNGASVTFISKQNPKLSWQGGNVPEVKLINRGSWGGWESIRVIPNGDGTVSFKDTNDGKFFTVAEQKIVKTESTESSDENGRFVIHSILPPEKVTDVAVSEVDDVAVTVSWTGVKNTIYTGYKVVATPDAASGKAVVTSEETAQTSVRLEGLERGTAYEITVQTVNADCPAAVSEAVSAQTKNGPRPVQATGLHAEEKDGNIVLTWDAVEGAQSYDVYRAESAYAEYTKISDGAVMKAEYTDKALNEKGKYSNYYKVVAVNENGESGLSDDYASLEEEMFGDHTLIFAPTDETAKIDEIIGNLFQRQNDFAADAQFKGEQYQVYFKPGDYTQTACMNLGFYTSFNGLGKTPYDVKLNNISIPAYLPAGELGGDGNNATCNFWRSTENLSVINTGNEQGKAQNGSWRPEHFNWAVAQAAPLRRVYSSRPVSFDWNYGWASGGYVADCRFEGTFDDNGNQLSAGTFSGQQFYTRNSEITGNAFGTTLNNFFQGVTAPNLPQADGTTGNVLLAGNGASNWQIPAADGGQQVFTNIEKTPKLSEKPFLYLDDQGEYQVFVPAMKENTSGTSWSEGNMGEGKSIPLADFYIARPADTAKTINKQIEAGKHIYFTPGTYRAEEPIRVNKENAILLGTGMASIIPDNEKTAMEIGDVDGVKVAGLIFDAGENSECLLKVGEEGTHTDHSANPTILQDLFFRIGGTTDTLTTAENALVINSDDVIGDHFWIWRADHGAGVAWDGNAAQHGVIVNGDDVTCYALFNEHFEKYDTLWNGENGATYFYQNEKCYDPVSQEAWMSHNGTVNGYAAYKVSNNVKKHYAVGLGMYNVFIYTGPTYDSTDVQIQMDSAVEVPNSEDVLIENACIQTFAKEDGVMQKFNHIINEVGDGVSSGVDKETGEKGEGWSRKFLISYQNGTAVVGKTVTNEADKGKFIGVDTLEGVKSLGDDDLALEELQAAVEAAKELKEAEYTPESWEPFAEALAAAESGDLLKYGVQKDVDDAVKALTDAQAALKKKPGTGENPGGKPEETPEDVTNPYNAWKKSAIISPERGQLKAAGPITVTWNGLLEKNAEVTAYEVYLDEELAGTVENEGEEQLSFDVYTTATAAHKIQVAAILKNGDKVHSNVRTFYVSKKGMSVDNAQVTYPIQNMGESWYYNWSTAPYEQYTGNAEFVPMVWNGNDESMNWLAQAKEQGYAVVLGFNEPNLSEQANMSVEEAVALQPQFTDSGLRVGASVVAGWPSSSEWFADYMQAAGEQVDFIPMHLYMGYPGEEQVKGLLDEIRNTYDKYNKPIWITEVAFASSDPNWTGLDETNDEYREKTKEAMTMLINGAEGKFAGLEGMDFVERYAWFSFDTNHTQGGVSSLYETNDRGSLAPGELTELGELYRTLGNPEGYVLPGLDGKEDETARPEDVYVADKLTGSQGGSGTGTGSQGSGAGNGGANGTTAGGKKGNVKTGDTAQTGRYLALLLGASGVLVFAGIRRKRKQNR